MILLSCLLSSSGGFAIESPVDFLLWNSFFVFFFDCLCFEFLLRQVLLMNLMKNVMRLTWFNLLNFKKIQWIQILNIVLTSNNTCSLRISELASCFLCLNTCLYLGFTILLSNSQMKSIFKHQSLSHRIALNKILLSITFINLWSYDLLHLKHFFLLLLLLNLTFSNIINELLSSLLHRLSRTFYYF